MCSRLRPLVVILLTASPWICTARARAHADAPEPLGTAGQWIVGGDAGGTYEQRSTKGEAAGLAFVDVEHFSVWVAPSALHFVAMDFALGGSVFAGVDRYDRADGVAIDEFGLGASAALAYRAGLGPRLFLLPKLAIGATRVARAVTSSRASVLGDDDAFLRWTPAGARESALSEALTTDVTALHAALSLPLAFSPAAGLFFGIGPYLQARYAVDGILAPGARDWALALGVTTVIGFWL